MTHVARAVPALLLAAALALASTPAHASTTIRIKDARGDERGIGTAAAQTIHPGSGDDLLGATVRVKGSGHKRRIHAVIRLGDVWAWSGGDSEIEVADLTFNKPGRHTVANVGRVPGTGAAVLSLVNPWTGKQRVLGCGSLGMKLDTIADTITYTMRVSCLPKAYRTGVRLSAGSTIAKDLQVAWVDVSKKTGPHRL